MQNVKDYSSEGCMEVEHAKMGKHTAQTAGLGMFTKESFYTHSAKSEWAALGT